MRNMAPIYAQVHTKMIKECSMQENTDAAMAVLGKLYTMTKRFDLENADQAKAMEMMGDAVIIVEQLAKYCPNITWKAVVDACEERVYEDARPRITPVNIVRWSRNHYAVMPKPKVAYQEIAAPVEASLQALELRYQCCLALWAHGKRVWDVGHLAYMYLLRTGRLPSEPTVEELQQMEPYVRAAISAEKSESKERERAGFGSIALAMHKAQFGIKETIIKGARLLNYIEKHEDKQKLQEELPAPSSILGY
jgi:hypothetical protein